MDLEQPGPFCDRWYNVSDDRYIDLVPRRAYYDNRMNRNLVLVLAEMLGSDELESSIIMCEMNGYYSKVRVIKEDTWWLRTHKPGHSHYNTFIQCIEFPEQAIRHGSTVRIISKLSNDSCYHRVATEKPLVLMGDSTRPTQGRGSVVVCSTLFGRPPYVNEWLRYQKFMGVDKVHLNVEASFAENATTLYPELRDGLNSGFVEMEVWKNYVGDRMYYYAQIVKYQDCLMRYAGFYEYAFLHDSDDFFNPMIPGKDIHHHLKLVFNSAKLSSVRFRWRKFECRPVASVYKNLPDGNITRSLGANTTTSWIDNYKSVYRLASAGLVAVHGEYKLLSGHRWVIADPSVAYMAHIRHGDKC